MKTTLSIIKFDTVFSWIITIYDTVADARPRATHRSRVGIGFKVRATIAAQREHVQPQQYHPLGIVYVEIVVYNKNYRLVSILVASKPSRHPKAIILHIVILFCDDYNKNKKREEATTRFVVFRMLAPYHLSTTINFDS